ncbi:protein O-GlcNAcase [Neobacillus sp. MER 74]|uniref:beta-N-acetylglucosaminidase domain-containing protein n=1 Tax=Neobacillus sp. MER 74 TaxID=2939566 RepID=UPI00203A627B|nr:beta-N-acetylglucosaminidase domain-containing protein [Neobacillus sp. MER 74]MCM3115036.1 protein O-GlcNAcase [Neobacillus sp. MER 74]
MTDTSFFPVRGVIEGFYGLFYTAPERNNLISFIAENDFNLYIYGPKNDRQHRARWREPYPDLIMEQFAETVKHSMNHGVEFCYSLGSGVSINYASEEDFHLITTKYKAFYDIGVRHFMIMLDDIAAEFHHEEERLMFNSYAGAHIHIANRLLYWLKSLDQSCKLSLCPTDYHGKAPFSDYIYELGKGLDQEIDIFYTGPEICSETISEQAAADFAAAVQRKPIIWDNYPVNDLAMTNEMHIGPITGRDARLPHVCKGFIVNTMSQAEASKIALLTFADYFKNPACYEPWSSWEKALKTIAGNENYEAIKLFAENSLFSCLGYPEAPILEQLVQKALSSLHLGETASVSKDVQKLFDYLDSLDEAGYLLKYRMSNYALRNNLVQWIELMESMAWAGRRAITVLRALENNEDITAPLNWLKESAGEIRNHPKRYAGSILLPLIEFVETKVDKKKSNIFN